MIGFATFGEKLERTKKHKLKENQLVTSPKGI